MNPQTIAVEKDPKRVELDADHSQHDTDQSSDALYIDPEVERRCIRKFDLLVMPQIVLVQLLSYLDRSNIGNARVMGLEADTGLTGTQFNNVASFFFVTFSIFEVPWGIVVKHIGVNRALAVGIVGWSAITIGTGFARNYQHLIACRLLLGIFESVTAPAVTILISMMYPRAHQAKRMATFFYGICVSGAFGGLIAYGVQRMGVRHGLEAWRWLFIIEGIISLVYGLVSWVSLPTNAEAAWFLNAQERATMAASRQRDMSYRGKEKFEWESVRMAFTDVMIYICAVTGFVVAMPMLGFSLFTPTLILALGFTRLEANYLSIPLYVLGTLTLALTTWMSDKWKHRANIMIVPALVGAIGYAVVIGSDNSRVGLMAMFFVAAGVYPCLALGTTWFSNNLAPDNKRAVALPFVLAGTLASGALSSQLYPSRDGPRYIMGNSVSLGALVFGACGFVLMWFIWRRRNARKSKALRDGVTANKYKDDRELNFVYVL